MVRKPSFYLGKRGYTDQCVIIGKVFYMTLEGEGKNPVMHFGMTGMLQVRPLSHRTCARLSTFNMAGQRRGSDILPREWTKESES